MRLSEGVDKYVARKRASGLVYTNAERRFLSFSRQMGEIELDQITTEDLGRYLGEPEKMSATWHANYLRLLRFFEYWTLQGAMPQLTMPQRPARARPTSCPYVYSLPEIRRLLDATAKNQMRRGCLIDPRTFRMYLILLYATGTTIGELIGLKRADVNLRKRSIQLHNLKYGRFRQIPIGDDLRVLLGEFLRWRYRTRRKTEHLFTDRMGRPITAACLTCNFSKLRSIAGVMRRDGSKSQPRLLDFRDTFAVPRIAAWIKDGADLNRMLPALAVYMGQVGLGSVESYLNVMPERFRKHLAFLSPKRGRKPRKSDPKFGAHQN